MKSSTLLVLMLFLMMMGKSSEFFLNNGNCLCPPPPPPCVIHTCLPAPACAPPQSCQPTSYGGSYALPFATFMQPTTSSILSPQSYAKPAPSYTQTSSINYQQPKREYTFPFNDQLKPPIPYVTGRSSFSMNGGTFDQSSLFGPVSVVPATPSTRNVVEPSSMQSSSHMTSYLESSLDALDDNREEDGERISEDIYDEEWPQTAVTRSPLHKDIIEPLSTERLIPYDVFDRRYLLLKRMKKRRQSASRMIAVSPTKCNNRELADIMSQAIDNDVGKSKRSIIKAIENAFDGVKFDVLCAQGDFSYTVHSRRHCEATKGSITCLAFR